MVHIHIMYNAKTLYDINFVLTDRSDVTTVMDALNLS